MWICDIEYALEELRQQYNGCLNSITPAYDGIVFETTAFDDSGEPLCYKYFHDSGIVQKVKPWRKVEGE